MTLTTCARCWVLAVCVLSLSSRPAVGLSDRARFPTDPTPQPQQGDGTSNQVTPHLQQQQRPRLGRVGGDGMEYAEPIAAAQGEVPKPASARAASGILLTMLDALLKLADAFSEQVHKKLLPLAPRDWAGFVLAALSMFIAAGGGLGGGGLLVPIYISVLGLSTHAGVALSNVTILGGAVANLIINIGRSHPFRPGPLIDWDVCLMMEPSTVLGALVGGYANKVLPSWLTTCMLAMLLVFTGFKLLNKALATWRLESNRLQRQRSRLMGPHCLTPAASGGSQLAPKDGKEGAEEHNGNASVGPSVLQPRESDASITQPLLNERARNFAEGEDDGSLGFAAYIDDDDPDDDCSMAESAALQVAHGPVVRNLKGLARTWSVKNRTTIVEAPGIIEEPQVQVPLAKLGALVFVFVAVLASDLSKQLVPCGSLPYWALVLAVLPVLGAVMAASRRHLLQEYHAKVDSGTPFVEGDVKWDERHTIVYPAASTAAGLVAGMFGVGGGIVKGPLMLEMGVLPDVAAATSATMILFTSASASVVYLSFGALPLDYGAVACSLGFVITLAGQLFVYKLMKLLGRRSIIIFAMVVFMALAAAAVTVQAASLSRHAALAHDLWDFKGIC